jgi:DNA modification methylase
MNQRAAASALTRRAEHTFHGNSRATRHGWLRLTPAYSVRLVAQLLSSGTEPPVLDPFCGTGTTLLSCAEQGIDCDSVDINPFLIWLARAKTSNYSPAQLAEARLGLLGMQRAARARRRPAPWVPSIHQIEKWWNRPVLAALGRSWEALKQFATAHSRAATHLLEIAFCQVLIETSQASFGHQSMSFAAANGEDAGEVVEAERVASALGEALERLRSAAAVALPSTARRLVRLDARRLHERLPLGHYASVITSPPYANRMSYIRELRPYMYWLGYLQDRKQAGVLDWKAIGGTWGSATSNLSSWKPDPKLPRAERDLERRLAAIAEHSPLLSNYVRKYFEDMSAHLASLAQVLRAGAKVNYVIGNSKFYDVVVPVHELLASELERSGFRHTSIDTLRKRSSKKELFEYLVSARRR